MRTIDPVTRLRYYSLEIICYLMLLLFAYAGLVKLFDHQSFVADLRKSPLLSSFAFWISFLLPLTELVVALLVVFDRSRLIGLYGSFFLMLLFTFYIIAVTHFSASIPCSCGGIFRTMSWNEHLLFNIVFCLLALAGLTLHYRHLLDTQAVERHY